MGNCFVELFLTTVIVTQIDSNGSLWATVRSLQQEQGMIIFSNSNRCLQTISRRRESERIGGKREARALLSKSGVLHPRANPVVHSAENLNMNPTPSSDKTRKPKP